MPTPAPASLPRPFLLACPDLSAERAGNTDTPGVWHFDSGVPGKSVMLSALIHGNELCGAWALKEALAAGLRPRRGSLTLAFCNLAAFDRFDPATYAPYMLDDEVPFGPPNHAGQRRVLLQMGAVSAAASEQRVAVTVADTGIGMDPQDVEIAFQPFGQVDNRLERRYEGTGLGLPLTKALVDLHSAAIAIDSARGRGTRVTVTFPRAMSEELAEAV